MKSQATPSAVKARILLVEDHQIVREGIAGLSIRKPTWKFAASRSQCERSAEADREAQTRPRDHGHFHDRDERRRISQASQSAVSGLPAVVLSMHDEALYAERALRAGALAFVMKKESSDEVMTAIRKARRGEYHVSEKVGGGIFQKFLKRKKPAESPIALLSDRELEVFELLGRGHGSKEIASELNLSVKTVDTHRGHIKEKLQLRELHRDDPAGHAVGGKRKPRGLTTQSKLHAAESPVSETF